MLSRRWTRRKQVAKRSECSDAGLRRRMWIAEIDAAAVGENLHWALFARCTIAYVCFRTEPAEHPSYAIGHRREEERAALRIVAPNSRVLARTRYPIIADNQST